MFRTMRMAALAVAMTLAFSGLALARDHDDDHRDRHARRDRDHDRDHDRDDRRWRDRDRDDWRHDNGRHRGWWRGDGDHDRDDGYYNRGSYRYPGGGYGYPGVYGYPGGGYGYPGGGYGSGLYNRGYQDGNGQARRDMSQGKPFNPNPRGGENRGPDYNNGYRAGYQSTFRGNRGYWGY
jgi:hypothetical protein